MVLKTRKGTRYTNKVRLNGELQMPPVISGLGPHYGDIGMIAVACGIGLLALIVGLRPESQIATAAEQAPMEGPQQIPSIVQHPLKPLTLDELLQELRKRLAQEHVATKVDMLHGRLRLLSNAPLFALSQPIMDSAHTRDARKVAEALAWAARCHIDFQDSHDVTQSPSSQVCPLGNRAETQSFASCLQDRGRVSISHIRFEGHADSVPFRAQPKGEFHDNQSLSTARAERFADNIVTCAHSDLKRRGSSSAMPYEAIGLGSEYSAEQSGRDPRNRRIEVRFRTDKADSALPGSIKIN
jgi:flagellar motor protein MotB